MLKRKAYDKLLEWKNNRQGKTSLLIEGARRVGKSTLVKEFGKNEYESMIFIDFATAHEDVTELFHSYRDNLEYFFQALSVHFNVKLYDRKSLIVFDEVQLFPIARGFQKYLVEDGRYDYISTGSLISIKKNISGIVIPSEEKPLELAPFDFEEFLWAVDEKILANFLRDTVREGKEGTPDALHKKATRLYREYLIVGGMPQAINSYLETRDFRAVDEVKRGILNLYRNDIARYAGTQSTNVTAIFDMIPSQLSKEKKRFVLRSLKETARMREYEKAFYWLQDSKIVNICFNTTDPSVGLNLSLDQHAFKCYLADTGLLVTQAFATKNQTSNEIHKSIIAGKLEINEGMLVENAAAQTLRANGNKLFYYSRSDRNDSDSTMEVDFLVVDETGLKAKVSPIEVKSTKRYNTSSLDKFKKKFRSKVGQQYIVHTGSYRVEGEKTYIPLYLLPWWFA